MKITICWIAATLLAAGGAVWGLAAGYIVIAPLRVAVLESHDSFSSFGGNASSEDHRFAAHSLLLERFTKNCSHKI